MPSTPPPPGSKPPDEPIPCVDPVTIRAIELEREATTVRKAYDRHPSPELAAEINADIPVDAGHGAALDALYKKVVDSAE